MGYLDATKAALVRRERVDVAGLFEFRFASQTKRFWTGIGGLTAGGVWWQASGEAISVSGIEQAAGGEASQATFTLSGVDQDLVQFASRNQAEVTNRPARVFVQFMSDENEPLDDPVALWFGLMDIMRFSGTGPVERTITLTAENLFAKRNRAVHGMQTNADQQIRYPGDTGYQFAPLLKNKIVPWLRQ